MNTMPSPLTIAFLLYPGVTQLDLTGPAQFLSRLGNATVPDRARQGPGDAFGQNGIGDRQELLAPATATAQVDLQNLVQDHAAQARVGLGAQGVKRAQLQHMAGVNCIGIADQRLDFGDGQLLRSGRDRGTG